MSNLIGKENYQNLMPFVFLMLMLAAATSALAGEWEENLKKGAATTEKTT